MPNLRSSRELAQRVDHEFHKRRNRFRIVMWTAGLLAGVGCVAWLGVAGLRGQQAIYEPGPLSTVHGMLDNNCAQCHEKWAAWTRLTSLSNEFSSVPNGKCIVCHEGPAHHASQIPAHDELKCASCHGEHRGDVKLTLLANEHCTNCHSNLESHGGTGLFAQSIDSFDGSTGSAAHPEFALLGGDQSGGRPASAEPEPIDCAEDLAGAPLASLPQNPDAARIRFNHKVHLQARYVADGSPLRDIDAFRDETNEILDCGSCHQPDDAGRYMLPISYERHCASCHPLLFDNRRHPGQSVPHAAPCVVRGFLTERYTLDALRNPPEAPPAVPQQPALPSRGLLSEESAQQVQQNVLAAEKQVLKHMHTLLGREAGGGCRYCHEVTGRADDGNWKIRPPQIPERWYLHSRFRHDSHRMLDCNSCHRDFSQSAEGRPVAESEKTSDVLLPPIAVCRKCHTAQPPAGGALASVQSFAGARTNCVECHTYHTKTGVAPRGTLGFDLEPIKDDR